jgi:hypothetical protein
MKPFLFIIALLSISCVKENAVPAYLRIEPFTMTTTAEQGTNLQKITDGYIFVGSENRGAYELPAKIPTLNLGEQKITVFPGIRNNGVKSNPIIYPFARRFEQTLTLAAAKIDTIRPKTSYSSDALFRMVENFDGAHNPFSSHRDNNVTFVFTNQAGGVEGNAAKITLDQTRKLMLKATNARFQFPKDAQNIYMEFHYKTDVALSVGFTSYDAIGSTTGTDFFPVVLYPKKDWNKTYINITNEVKAAKGVEFQMTVGAALPDSLTSAAIWLDNFKLLQR